MVANPSMLLGEQQRAAISLCLSQLWLSLQSCFSHSSVTLGNLNPWLWNKVIECNNENLKNSVAHSNLISAFLLNLPHQYALDHFGVVCGVQISASPLHQFEEEFRRWQQRVSMECLTQEEHFGETNSYYQNEKQGFKMSHASSRWNIWWQDCILSLILFILAIDDVIHAATTRGRGKL